MAGLDFAILGLYLAVLLIKAVLLTRRAGRSEEDYFLAGRRSPWWALGASGMSSNLDAAGTMTLVALVYLFGLHGLWIEMRGGVVLPIAVFLAFMGKWHQRSRVITTGEWMSLRFGDGPAGRAARVTAAATYLIISVAMVVFFLSAAGRFLSGFLPLDPAWCAAAMAAVALTYTLLSGLYGVIWTDVLQAGLIAFAAIYVAVLAAGHITPELLDAWPGAAFNTPLPVLTGGLEGPAQPGGTAMYEPFLLFLMFWVGKGLLEGLGGSGGSAYMAQRFYAAQDVTTVKRLCLLWTVLFAFRWPMVLGFAILGVALGLEPDRPEDLLGGVLLSDLFPAGVRGLLVTAVFAASMSTFDSTINAGASYAVRDLYLPLVRPDAGPKQQVRVGYAASAAIVAAGLGLSLLLADGVLSVWTTIVVQLFPAFLLPFALRWFWGRFNGWGFTAGVVAGFLGSLTLAMLPDAATLGLPNRGPLVQQGVLTDVAILGCVGLCSLAGCLVGTLLTRPTDNDTLRRFYQQIRPLGRWPRPWKRGHTLEHRGDLGRLALALPWQVSTFLLPMLLVLRQWPSAAACAAVCLATGLPLLLDAARASPTPAGPPPADG